MPTRSRITKLRDHATTDRLPITHGGGKAARAEPDHRCPDTFVQISDFGCIPMTPSRCRSASPRDPGTKLELPNLPTAITRLFHSDFMGEGNMPVQTRSICCARAAMALAGCP